MTFWPLPPQMPTSPKVSPPASAPRRKTVIASGLLCGALALVVIFTNRRAFFSPTAIVIVAAIGAAAVLMQLQLRNRRDGMAVPPPVLLNLFGIACALGTLFADRFSFRPQLSLALACAAIGSFAVSSIVILHGFRKQRLGSKE